MSAIISVLPLGTSADRAGGDEERVTRTIEIYERIARAPAQSFDPEAVGAALRALHDGREQDALELIEIAFEEPDASLIEDDVADEEDEGSPIPDSVKIWRHVAQPKLVCVADAKAPRPPRSESFRLAAKRAMTESARHDAEIGDLQFDRQTCQAVIDLGARGELILLLHSGTLTIDVDGALEETEIRCAPGAIEVVRLVFVAGRGRSASMPLRLHLSADPSHPPQGLWCTSMIRAAEPAAHAGNDDLVFVTRHAPITAMTADAFCEGATPAPMSPRYSHRSAIERGDFARHVLGTPETSTCGAWALDERSCSTEVLGLAAVTQPIGDAAASERELVSHGGALELIVGIDGVTWAAVSPSRRDSTDDPGQHVLLLEKGTDGGGEPVFITPLVGTPDGRLDAMLLRPDYAHAVWLTPETQARFVHVMFDDPARIDVRRVGRGAVNVADRGARKASAG